jgi:hypothetical protein
LSIYRVKISDDLDREANEPVKLFTKPMDDGVMETFTSSPGTEVLISERSVFVSTGDDVDLEQNFHKVCTSVSSLASDFSDLATPDWV